MDTGLVTYRKQIIREWNNTVGGYIIRKDDPNMTCYNEDGLEAYLASRHAPLSTKPASLWIHKNSKFPRAKLGENNITRRLKPDNAIKEYANFPAAKDFNLNVKVNVE